MNTVKQYVRGENTQSVFGWAATGVPSEGDDITTTGFSAPTFSAPVYEAPQYQSPKPGGSEQGSTVAPPHEATQSSMEQPMTDPGEVSDNISHGVTQPVPTSQQRKFSAPHMEWDATR